MIWLYQLPHWLLVSAIIGGFTLCSLAGLAATRHWIRRPRGEDVTIVVAFVSAVGVLYAVLLAMIAVATWTNYTLVDSLVSQEANAVHAIFRDVEGYPPAQRERLRGLLREYVRLVVHTEWPALQKGIIEKRAGLVVDTIFQEILGQRSQSDGDKFVTAEVLERLNTFQILRRSRIQTGVSGVEPVLWLVVMFGGVMNLALTYLFWMENYRLQQVLTAGLGLTIGLVIYVIVALDHPLWGEVSVSPAAFEAVADSMDRLLDPMTPAQRRLSNRP
jgi:hypothetical protein